ncbi:hypothetical protein ATCC90586_000005 [Pythium insidiosum]|nr:hypothetical protein ATCC90586_000005 [Pythium insidiosum]
MAETEHTEQGGKAAAAEDVAQVAGGGVDNAVRADEVLVGGKWPTEALYYVAGSKLRGSAATFFASMEAIAATADRTARRARRGEAELDPGTRGRAPEAAPVNLVQTTGEVGGAAVNPDVKGECTVA